MWIGIFHHFWKIIGHLSLQILLCYTSLLLQINVCPFLCCSVCPLVFHFFSIYPSLYAAFGVTYYDLFSSLVILSFALFGLLLNTSNWVFKIRYCIFISYKSYFIVFISLQIFSILNLFKPCKPICYIICVWLIQYVTFLRISFCWLFVFLFLLMVSCFIVGLIIFDYILPIVPEKLFVGIP